MQKVLAFLVPPFLRKIDRYLLLNYPRFWATKVHYVVFYGLLINLACALFAFAFFNPGLVSDFSYQFIWIVICAEALVFIFWLYIQSFASVEKEYGNTSYAVGVIEAVIYAICVALIFSPALVMLKTGIARTAYRYGNQKNVCNGSQLLDFYSGRERNDLQDNYDINKIQKALQLVQDTINSGVANEGDIRIEYIAVISRENGEFVLDTNNYGYIYSNGKIIVGDGNAAIEIRQGDVTINRKNTLMGTDSPFLVKNGERAEVKSGDEIIYDGDFYTYFTIISGRITVRSFYTYKLEKTQAFIVKKGNGMDLVMGEAPIIAEGRGASYEGSSYGRGTWSFDNMSAYHFCQSFSNQSKKSPDDYLHFLALESWNILFIILGVLFAQILKHSNWSTLILSFLYMAELSAISFLVLINADKLIFYENSSSDGNVYKPIIVIIFSIVVMLLFMLIQSMEPFRTQKYQTFAFMNFVGLPVAFGYFGFLLVAVFLLLIKAIPGITQYEALLLYLPLFFLVYLLFTPIQKKLFMYLMSLPRE